MVALAQMRDRTARSFRISQIVWPEIAILLLAFAIQIPIVLNADLGWLLTVAERMLAGAKLGEDILELNPPLSVLMYMPAAYLGTLLPIPAHIFVIIMVLAGVVGSTNLTLKALDTTDWEEGSFKRARLVLFAVFALVPGMTFAQREHIAVLAMAPFVALAAAHASQRLAQSPNTLRLAVGICGGFAMCIKPHFVFMAGLPLLWAAWRCRSIRPLLGLEGWLAAAIVMAYFGTSFLVFPDYFTVYPRWAAVAYLPLRMAPSFFYAVPVLSVFAAIAFLLHLTCGRNPAQWAGATPWILAALGGFLSYVLQGKGFPYMRLPAVAFAVLAPLLSPAFLSYAFPRASRGAVLALCLVPTQWLLVTPINLDGLQKVIRAMAPAHPKMLAVSSNGSIGQPLVRLLDGEWASIAGSQLLAAGADFRLEYDVLNAEDHAMATQIVKMERDRLRDELQQRRPDVLLIDNMRFGRGYNWEAWARVDPAIDRELNKNYRLTAHTQGIAVWLRR